MPLTEFQAGVARLLAPNRSVDSYLAGGAALHLEPNTKRYSNDLDYFQDSEERVASAFAEDRAALERAGYELEVQLTQPGFVRALVRRRGEATRIEWSRDSAWRFLPPVRIESVGYTLHPIDLALNKVLALAGRDEPRDFLDVMHCHESLLPLGALCWAACGKDPGFTPTGLLSLLRRRGKYRPEEFDRLDLRERPDLVAMKEAWRSALDEAEAFVRSRPADEIGCLYYSTEKQAFVGEFAPGDPGVLPHHGRPGGVLPSFDRG